MDATNKTLSGVLVTLLVASILTPAATALHGPAPNPTAGVATAIVDAVLTHTETVGSATWTVNNQTTITFNTPYDLTITNLNAPVQSTFRLFRAGSSTPFGNPASAAADLEHTGRANTTFTNVALDTVGVWYANQTTDENGNAVSGGASAVFVVGAQPNLQVSLSTATFPYATSSASYTVTVTNLSAGQTGNPVASATLTGAGIPVGTTTNAQGTYTFFGALPQAGVHTITATRDYNGDGLPELQGNTTLTITAAALTVTGSNTVYSGFADTASWDVTFPNGTNVFGNTGSALNTSSYWQWANLSVLLPNGSTLYSNLTNGFTAATCQSAFALAASGTMRLTNTTDGCITPTDTPLLTFATGAAANGGRITFRPGALWASGTYSFSLGLSTVGGTSGGVAVSAPEYSGTWTQTTTAPSAVNLKAYDNNATTVQLTSANGVNVLPATLGAPPTGVLGAYTLALDITGSTATEFPTTLAWDAFTASNVTVTGDVLTGAGFNTVSITGIGSTGRATITGVVPTKVNGAVNLNVNWKNVTTTLSLPIKEGADSSASTAEIVVDQTTPLTVTVKDAFGNPVPTASLLVTNTRGGDYPGAAGVKVNGTGAPGLGQNGQYTLNVRPTETGDMIIYSEIGSNVGGVDNRNWSYLKVRVAPAHDLVVTLGTNSSMAGNLTYTYLNATTAEGFAVTTANNYRAYFLNATTVANLRTNGTSALSGITYAASSGLGQSLSSSGTGVYTAFGTNGLSGTNLNVSLDPGQYWVYVCSNFTVPADCTSAKHDNINNTPSFVSTAWHGVFTPDRIASNAQLQSNTLVTLKVTDRNGVAAPQGTLVRVGTTGTTGAVTPAIGTLTLNATGMTSFTATGQTIGDLVFETDTAGGQAHWTALDTPFKVVGPNIVVTPDRVPAGRVATVSVQARSLNGTPLSGLNIQVCGTPIGGTDAAPDCTSNTTTDANGFAGASFFPRFNGNLTLRVNGTNSATNVTVFTGLEILLSRSNPVEGETQEITAQVIGQSGGLPGTTVNVSYNGSAVSGFPQTTGSDGRVVVSNLRAGNYTVTAVAPGYEQATRSFTVTAASTTPTGAAFELANLSVPSSGNVGQPISVKANVKNVGSAQGTATVLLLVNGAVRDSRPVPVAAGATELVEFDFTPNTAGSFNVTVKLSTGESLAAKSVTVTTPGTTPVTTTPTTTTPVTTTPTTTTPVTTTPTATTTTPTTTTPATTTPSPEVPGFEVVALIGALGVALLVLRRRN